MSKNKAQQAVKEEEKQYDPITGYRREGDKIIFPGHNIARMSPGFKESPPAPTTGNKRLDKLIAALKEASDRKASLEVELQRYGDELITSLCAGGALARTGKYGRIMADLSETEFTLSQIQAAIDQMQAENEPA